MAKQIKRVIDDHYRKIENTAQIISLANIRISLSAQLELKVTDQQIKNYLNQHPNLLPLTTTQFICRKYFSILFTEFISYKQSYEEIKEFLAAEYPTFKKIKVKELLTTFNPKFVEFIEERDNQNAVRYIVNDNTYQIKSEDDLVEFGLENGYVSETMVKEFVEAYEVKESDSQYNHFDLINKFEKKGIEYLADENSRINPSRDDSVAKERKNYYALLDIDYSNQNNALLVDLRVNQLIALLLVMEDSEGLVNKLKVTDRGKYERDLLRLDLINEDYTPTKKGWKLANKVVSIAYKIMDYEEKKELVTSDYSLKELCKSKPIKKLQHNSKFWDQIAPFLRKHYLSLPAVKVFVSWIKAINQKDKSSMYNLFQYALKNKFYRELEWILIGDRPSGAQKPIKTGEEICLKCNEKELCFAKSKTNKKEYLLKLRNKQIKEYIQNDFKDNYDNLQIPVYVKFLVPYFLVTRIKLFMRKLKILRTNSKILYKDSGMYCPVKDQWELGNNDLLV